jgi:putative peptide zinc metalloprotease protein
MTATPQPLPALRRDITIEPFGVDHEGMPVVTVFDPLRANYFRVHWPESAILPIWQTCATPHELCKRAEAELGLSLSGDDIGTIADFLYQNQLTLTDPKGGWQRYHAMAEAGKHGWMHALVHNYLFFRIPLVHPQAFLARIQPHFEFIFTKAFAALSAVIVCAGAYLISRQWDDFAAMFRQTENLPSLTVFAVVLLLLKLIHELGHAIVTVRAGCRVPSMGVAFMLGAPVLYTDTTDSWRLPRRSQRLAVVGAGVGAEMIVAAIALFFVAILGGWSSAANLFCGHDLVFGDDCADQLKPVHALRWLLRAV